MNLESPVFAYYIKVDALSRRSADEMIDTLNYNLIKNYPNVTFLVVPADFTKVECIYDGVTSGYKIKKLLDSLREISQIIENEDDINKIKSHIREAVLYDILK